jgi:hypothetical protein
VRAFVILGRHVLSHGARGDAETELDEELVGDALFAPGDIVSGYPANQLLELLRIKGPAKNNFPFLGRRDARLARREAFIISRYMTDEQRSQTGWIGVPKWEVILGWALRAQPSPKAEK